MFLRFLATLALVPLVYMQTLDVYEWICIRGEEFCGTPEKQTNLSIYKTAITLTLNFCLKCLYYIKRQFRK